MGIEVFLTAYDPSDLPGGSVDVMGFDRGYNWLAERILPGLTNVASNPRYFAVLCAGVHLAEADPGSTFRQQYELKSQSVMRLERLWCLANVLAAEPGEVDIRGIRGVTYVQEEALRLQQRGATSAKPDFKMLSRQEPYGVLGIYGNVADGLGLLQRKSLTLVPDTGGRLGEAFLTETQMPATVKKAVLQGTEVGTASLRAWGAMSGVNAASGESEAECLRDVFHRDAVRSRMARRLRRSMKSELPELERLRALADECTVDASDTDLREAIVAILAFEDCYRLALLGLERLLWLSRATPGGVVSRDAQARDNVVNLIRKLLPGAARRLTESLENGQTGHLSSHRESMTDVRQFLAGLAAATDGVETCGSIVGRHRDVQHGKFDRGRKKSAWLDEVEGGFALSATRTGGLRFEATVPDHITPHAYRTAAVDGFLRSMGK